MNILVNVILDDIKSAEELGKVAAEQTIRKLKSKKNWK